ncbi:MAG: acyl-CoA thioesterase [Pirellulales bacterium]|nr:acyl-CoA thioesterase [Pirellulales bacterium]
MTSGPSELSNFPVQVAMPVQWGDQDALGHVNAACYLTWFETARVELLRRLGWRRIAAEGVGPIVASITCNYRRPVLHPDTVIIGARVERVGRTSVQVEHAIWSEAHSAIVADGTSTVVTYDYEAKCPTPVPDELRAAIDSL